MQTPEQDLTDLVIVVTGATGAAGPAVVRRLAESGATVVAVGRDRARLDEVARETAGRAGSVETAVADLLDEQAVRALAAGVLADHGRVDGVVHLVGGWRGGAGIVEADLADYEWLHDHLVRTLQHVSRAFHDALRAGPRGRLVIISTHQVEAPSASNASYATAKAAAETWTRAVADSFSGSGAAAVVLPVKALLTPRMREARPEAAFSGYTPVADLARTIHDLWLTPADELNGKRL